MPLPLSELLVPERLARQWGGQCGCSSYLRPPHLFQLIGKSVEQYHRRVPSQVPVIRESIFLAENLFRHQLVLPHCVHHLLPVNDFFVVLK